MSDEVKKQIDELQENYSEEQLSLLQKLSTLQYSQAIYESQLAHDAASNEVELEKKVLDTKLTDLQVELVKTSMQPHVMHKAEIGYETFTGKYYCRLPITSFDMLGDEDGDFRAICAYGDSPQQACENFDILWVHGRTDV
jgi:hypothetical protein